MRDMTRLWLISGWLILGLWHGQPGAVTPQERGLEIYREGERRDQGWESLRADLIMVLRNRRGETSMRHLRGYFWEGGEDGDKNLLVFDSPADVKGTKFLTFSHQRGDDDQWLYLPALKRVKRISSANKGGAFMGSEFAYEDMTAPVLEKYEYRFLGEEEYKKRKVFVVERLPKDTHSLYSRQVSWIDQEHYIPWKTDYYNRRGDHLKTLTYHKYKRYLGKYWRPGKMLMINHRSGKATALLWKDYRFRAPEVDGSLFDPAALSR